LQIIFFSIKTFFIFFPTGLGVGEEAAHFPGFLELLSLLASGSACTHSSGEPCCVLSFYNSFPSYPMAFQEAGSPEGPFGFSCSASTTPEQLHKAFCGQVGKHMNHGRILRRRRGVFTTERVSSCWDQGSLMGKWMASPCHQL